MAQHVNRREFPSHLGPTGESPALTTGGTLPHLEPHGSSAGDPAAPRPFLLAILTLVVALTTVAPAAAQGTTADVVYGQGGSFTTNILLSGGVVSADSLNAPFTAATDRGGNLYVCDFGNSRVLFYPAGSTTATRVYGTGDSFAVTGSNYSGGRIGPDTLNSPEGVATDSLGNLYVVDQGNNRVLFFPPGSTTATQVYGQLGDFTTAAVNNGLGRGGVTATGLYDPVGVAVDSNDNLYVVDRFNNRVLVFPAGSTTPSGVYGAADFTNTGLPFKDSFYLPFAVAIDNNGNVYVADWGDNRVLFFPAGTTTSTRVYGQLGDFNNATLNNGGVSSDSLGFPIGLATDSNSNLYVSDSYNNRVLFYPAGSTTAARVYGQSGSFSSSAQNTGGVSADSLADPGGLAINSSNGHLYVVDYGNNRVLGFPPSTPLTVTANNASMVYGGPVPSLTATAVGLVGIDTLQSLGVTCTTTATSATGVGTYPITCSGVTSPNYTVTYVAGTLTVTPAPLTIRANDTSMVYGGPLPQLTATPAGLVASDTLGSLGVTCTTTATAASSVKTYPINCSGVTSANYTVSYIAGTLTVSPATLTVTANNTTKLYGAAVPAFTASITDFVNGDMPAVVSGSPSLTTAATATSIVGAYSITAAQGTLTAANYTFGFVNGTLNVTPAPLTVTATNTSMPYGSPLPQLTATAAGLVGADTLQSLGNACTTAATSATGVGMYPITCSGVTSANYTVSYVGGTLTVTPAPLVVTGPTLSRVWGSANPALPPVITGFVNQQTSAVLTTQPTCSTTATPASPVAAYPVTCTGGTATNYAFTSYQAGTLTVTTALMLTPAALNFANVRVGSSLVLTANLTSLTSIGGLSLTIARSLSGPNVADFAIVSSSTCGKTLAAGASCNISVRFRPMAPIGPESATLNVSASGNPTATVALSGTGVAPAASASPATVPFGGVTRGQVSGSQTVTVTNTGTGDLTFNAKSGFSLGGANAAQFQLTPSAPCANGGILPPGSSCTVSVAFAPKSSTALGAKSTMLSVRSNAANGTQTVTLTGTAQ